MVYNVVKTPLRIQISLPKEKEKETQHPDSYFSQFKSILVSIHFQENRVLPQVFQSNE